MLERRTLARITTYVVAVSVLATALGFVFGSVGFGFGVLVGSLFSNANWVAMRWVARRLIVASDKGRAIWGGLLAAKMFVALILVWAVLSTGAVDPIGFTVGLSSLVLGILAGAFHAAATAPSGAPSVDAIDEDPSSVDATDEDKEQN